MEYPKVKMTYDNSTQHLTANSIKELEIDGIRASHVTELRINADVSSFVTVTVTFIAKDLSINPIEGTVESK